MEFGSGERNHNSDSPSVASHMPKYIGKRLNLQMKVPEVPVKLRRYRSGTLVKASAFVRSLDLSTLLTLWANTEAQS